MRIAGLFWLAAVFAGVAGEICPNCLKDGVFSTDLTHLEAADKVFVAAKPSARPPPPKPPPSQPPQLQPASDELIDKCINKGCLLDWSMRHNDNEVGPYYVPPRMTAQSPYLSWSDLQTWFWHNYPTETINPVYEDLYAKWGIGWVLEELGVSAYTDIYEGGKNRITSIVHSDPYTEDIDAQHYEVNGQRYRATGADYIMALNTEEGVIIGMNREGPAEANKERRPPVQANEMPQLHQFSDVCWIAWLELAKHNGHDPRNFRYFISISIINVETRSVVRRIMIEKHLGLDYWPGATFESGTPEFDAILGTPNIQGFAYMLVQHKAQLGNMFISKVQVFKCAEGELCIVAYVSQPVGAPGTGAGHDAEPVRERISGEVVRRDENHNWVRVHKIFAKL